MVPNHYTTSRTAFPDKVTFFFVLRHATRPNLRLLAHLAPADLLLPEYRW